MERPGDIYNKKGIDEAYLLLLKSGWREVKKKNNFSYLRRPGKKKGVSATFGYVAKGILYNFSSNAAPFDINRAYSPFGIYTFLKHNGNFSEAAQAIARRYKLERSKVNDVYRGDFLTDDNRYVFKPISLSDLLSKKIPPTRWLVDKLIPTNGISCISGVPKTGKSLFSLDLAYAVANGVNFLNKFKSKKGSVLIVNKEDSERLLQERMRELSSKSKEIYFYTSPNIYFDTDKYLRAVESFVNNNNIKLLIIDSFRRSFRGEENSSQTIAEVHTRFKKLLINENLTIVFVHHHGKEGLIKRKNKADKLRGSSDILAMLDSLLVIEKNSEDTLKLTQAALRQDKQVEPFIIQFINEDEKHFNFIDYIEEEANKENTVKELILSYIDGEPIETPRIIEHSVSLGFGTTTTKNALKSLLKEKKIERDTSSKTFKYFIPGNRSISQEKQGSLEI